MNTWKVILATMVIFGAGVVTGGLLVRFTSVENARQPRLGGANRAPQVMTPSGLRIELLRRVERELDISPEQRAQIDKIITASQDRIKKLMDPVTPNVREELQQTRDQVRAVLTPEQQPRFDELLKQQEKHPRDQKRPSSRMTDSVPVRPPMGSAVTNP